MARDGHRGGRLVLQGCDTSVLLVNAPGIDSELDGLGNLGIQGQEIVYNIKAAVEAECPGVVSCADILALASQVSVFLGGPSWKVLLGRRGGTTANRTGADNLPSPFETLEPLKRKNLWIWKIEIHTSACSKSTGKFKIVKEEEGLSRDDLVVVEEDSKLQTYASTKTVLCGQPPAINSVHQLLCLSRRTPFCRISCCRMNSQYENDDTVSHSKETSGVEKFVVKRKRNDKEEDSIEKKLEWRHCELCGGGRDGKALISMKKMHENDGWLGHLVGPIKDTNGIPRIWVHYQCIVWSPEVHFSGSGSLKNVKLAVKRGKLLKCVSCKRHGATLGCRIEECQNTYHLACASYNNCKFDHKEFLMACTDHHHIFQSHSEPNSDRQGKKPDGAYLGKIVPTFIGGINSNREDGKKDKLVMAGWESVAGLQHVIDCMKEVVILPLLYPKFFDDFGITPPRGVLLHGYPGTGKTHVVRALVGACARDNKRIAYFSRKGADCLGKYVGSSEKHLKQLFQVAEECQPSIIFFDEIDGLAPSRTGQQDQTHNSVVSTLLALLDGLKSRGRVVVIGATNRPNAIDPALRRPGRFDREIYFPLPSLEDRISILSLYTKKWPKTLESNQPLLQWIARKTLGFAGADLQALCTQTATIALKRNFPLKQVLFASKDHPTNHLPVVVVEGRDWLEALSSCPPPCSRRETSIAVNDVASSPLPSHLILCLIRPLSILLVSLYMEECICLPNTLSRAATIIQSVIVSVLERKKMVTDKWWLHVDDFIQENEIANEIERQWQRISHHSCFANLEEFMLEDNITNKGNSNKTSFDLENSFGFRIMIAGNPRSGQRHLASCILSYFVEHVEIRKVDMTTISQGGNNLGQAIAYTLADYFSRGSCLIFMPRLDLWAIDESHDGQTLESSEEECIRNTTVHKASSTWTIFIDQVKSFSLSTPFIFLATSEIPFFKLPQEIRHFFKKNLSNCRKLVAQEHKLPRFSIQIDETFNHDLVIDQSASKLSKDMVKLFILLIHKKNHEEQTHTTSIEDTNLVSAISIFGYQILQNPQFSYLCWVTSKLKEGPSANISESHSKDWKFNSCVLHPTSHLDSFQTEEDYGMVKGLVAVGLLATRGVYTSLHQVCSDVRVVLRILVEKVNAKIDAGKDKLQYIDILSQVASLEDTVYSWAYELQRLKQDSLKMGRKIHNTFTKLDPSGLPTSTCSIKCCSDCLTILYRVTKKIVMNEFRSKRFDWSTESIHEIVMSMSVKLLSALRKSFVDGKRNHLFDEKEREEKYDRLLKFYDLTSCGCKISRNMIVKPIECSCHSPSRTSNLKAADDSHLTQLKLSSKFVFCNNILEDTVDPREEVFFHCKFETLCFSSIIQLVVKDQKAFKLMN